MAVLVVAYDISDDRRRTRLAEELLAMGFVRVQRSVYIARTAYKGLRERVARAAARRIDPRTDTVLIMTVPEWSIEKALVIGQDWRSRGARVY